MSPSSQSPAGRSPGEHHGAFAILGPPIPRNPLRWVFLGIKAGAACLLALVADGWTGNPDHVTSTFVAVLCVSPVVLIGLRRSLDQVMGSLIGGIWGTLMLLAGLAPLWGIPLSVTAAILSCFRLGFGRGYQVAAFTALFVQAVPRGGPSETLAIRMMAVATGALAAFMVNLLISSMAYRNIFSRRLRYAESRVSALLAEAAAEGPQVARKGFALLAELDQELGQAREELRWRGGIAQRSWLDETEERLLALRRLLHLVLDLVYRLEEEGLPADSMQEWLGWLIQGGGQEPDVPDAMKPTTRRIRMLGQSLGQRSRELPSSTK